MTPTTSPGSHVVIGATGGVGAAVVDELVARDLPVVAVSRGAAPATTRVGVTWRSADVTRPSDLAGAVEGAAVVYQCANVPYHRWAEEFPALSEAVAVAAGRAGARLVMADNLYAYGPVAGPMREDLPQAATTKKGRVRAAMADRILELHAEGRVEATIGRLSDYYGPAGTSILTVLAIDPALRGKRGRWPGSLDVLHTCAYTPDAAKGLVTLALDDRSLGRIWHLPAAEAITGRRFVELVHATTGVTKAPGVVTPLMNRLAGLFVREAREGNEMAYEFTEPFVVDHSDFDATFGALAVTPHEQAVAATVAARRSNVAAAA